VVPVTMVFVVVFAAGFVTGLRATGARASFGAAVLGLAFRTGGRTTPAFGRAGFSLRAVLVVGMTRARYRTDRAAWKARGRGS
jgi:hypothetical protein